MTKHKREMRQKKKGGEKISEEGTRQVEVSRKEESAEEIGRLRVRMQT